MTKDECDQLQPDINRALNDGAVFSFHSLSHLVAAFPAEGWSMLKQILGEGEPCTGPYRVFLVQTSEFPDGKIFFTHANARHGSALILTVSNQDRYDAQRLTVQRILGRKCQLLTK